MTEILGLLLLVVATICWMLLEWTEDDPFDLSSTEADLLLKGLNDMENGNYRPLSEIDAQTLKSPTRKDLCFTCGKQFETNVSYLGTASFCSEECWRQWD